MSKPMKDVMCQVVFGSTKSSEIFIFRPDGHSRPTHVTSMNLCHISRMTQIDTILAIQYTSGHSKVRFYFVVADRKPRFFFLGDDEYDFFKSEKSKAMKGRLGISENPLDGLNGRVS